MKKKLHHVKIKETLIFQERTPESVHAEKRVG